MEESSWQSPRILSFKRQIYVCAWVPINSLLHSFVLDRKDKIFYIYQDEPLKSRFSREILTLGKFMFLFAAGFCMYYKGRQKSLLIFNTIFFFGWLMIVSHLSVTVHSLGNDLATMVIYALTAISFVYVTEVSNQQLRAFMNGLYDISQLSGYVIFTLAPPTTFHLHLLNFISLILLLVSTILSCLLPETPYWLAMNRKNETAEELLLWLRGDQLDEAEVVQFRAAIDSAVEEKRAGMLPNVWSERFGWRVFIIVAIALTDFSPSLLMNSGILSTRVNAEIFTEFFYKKPGTTYNFGEILKLALRLFGAIIFCCSSFLFGRRILFRNSIILFFIVTTAQFYLTDDNARISVHVLWIIFLAEYIGRKQILFILPTEIFPTVTRDFGVVAGVIIYTIRQYFEDLALNSSYFIVIFNIYWALFPVGLVLVYFFMPETQNLSLIQAEKAAAELHVLFKADVFDKPTVAPSITSAQISTPVPVP